MAAPRADAQTKIEVLESNVEAVRVFALAKPTYLVGFGLAQYHGLPTTEIRETAAAVGVRFNEDLLSRIRVLEAGFGEVANRK